MTGITPALKRNSASAAATPIASATASSAAERSAPPRPAHPCGQNTCQAKNTARFTITPTTAAVMPVSGAVKSQPAVRRFDQRTAGENEQEARQKGEERRDAWRAATPASASDSGPKSCRVQPPTKPTNATTMISGPGVVSPSARPSIICAGVSHA